MTRPHASIKIEIHMLGRINFNTMLLGTSRRVYGTKNSVTAVLYCNPCMFRSVVNPATFAFPTARCQLARFHNSIAQRSRTVTSIDECDEVQERQYRHKPPINFGQNSAGFWAVIINGSSFKLAIRHLSFLSHIINLSLLALSPNLHVVCHGRHVSGSSILVLWARNSVRIEASCGRKGGTSPSFIAGRLDDRHTCRMQQSQLNSSRLTSGWTNGPFTMRGSVRDRSRPPLAPTSPFVWLY